MKKLIFASLLLSATCFAVNRESGGMYGPSAIFLDFQSVGSGVDDESLQLYKRKLAEAKSLGLIDQVFQNTYGLEGEIFTCFRLHSVLDQRSFVRLLQKSIIKDYKATGLSRTKLYAGSSCDRFQEAKLFNIYEGAGR